MQELTNTQRTVLSGAVARDDGAANIPPKMSKAVSSKLATSLVGRKLMREVRTKRGMPVWRRTGDHAAFSLVITFAGKKALGVEDQAGDARMDCAPPVASMDKSLSNKRTTQRATGAANSTLDKSVRLNRGPAVKGCRDCDPPRSKRQVLIDMLSKPEGATLDQMVLALGWLPHTTRAELTRLRQRGLSITRAPRKDQASLYSLAAPLDTIRVGKAA